MNSLFSFWGKTGEGDAWHPAVCHMIDAGAVARTLLDRYYPPAFKRALAEPLGIPGQAWSPSMAFLVSLHDLGKISPGFQRKCPTLAPPEKDGFTYPGFATPDHGGATCTALGQVLGTMGVVKPVSRQISAALGAHHGVFPLEPPSPAAIGDGAWDEARRAILQELAVCWGSDWSSWNHPSRRLPDAWTIRLAGLACIADWLASDQTHFPLVGTSVHDLGEYREASLEQAGQSVESLGWTPCRERAAPSEFLSLFPALTAGPNPLQSECAHLAQAVGEPFFLLAEAPMGAGKTEAALWAADIARSRLGAGGVYYALPTQATSNAMFLRFGEFLKTRFPGREVPFYLLHGMAAMNEAFQEIRGPGHHEYPNGPTSVGDPVSQEGTLVASEWFLGRKRGLLAPFAVGTIDQALMGALTVKHSFLRLFALAGKTVVVDEVHAYDAYMSELLDRLLSWLRSLGANVVLLSATLPAKRRRALVSAFGGKIEPANDVPYPRVTCVAGSSVRAEHVSGSPAKTVTVRSCAGSLQGALHLLAEKIARGGCAAWICNTVGQAQEAFLALENDSRFAGLGERNRILFHARFPVEDRLRIERTVLERFGKKDEGRRPERAVVVATQVIEQSLDLDFDWMLTELPPVDLLLQRMGRLHRHLRNRPEGLEEPEIAWMLPDTDSQGRPSFGPSAHVYEPYLLLRTLRLLAEHGRSVVHLPEDVESWIESVYGEEGAPEERDPVHIRWAKQLNDKRVTLSGKAKRWIMPRPDGDDGLLAGLDLTLEDDEETAQKLTRLGEPTVQIICGHQLGEAVCLDRGGSERIDLARPPSRALTRRLLERSVRVAVHSWKPFEDTYPVPEAWREVPLLRSCPLAAFLDGVIGQGTSCLRLDARLGLAEPKVAKADQ